MNKPITLATLIPLQATYDEIVRMLEAIDKDNPSVRFDVIDASICEDCGLIHNNDDENERLEEENGLFPSGVFITEPTMLKPLKEMLRIYLLGRKVGIERLFSDHGLELMRKGEHKKPHLRIIPKENK